MCEFFSFVTDNSGKRYFFSAEDRTNNEIMEMGYRSFDSHASICAHFKLNEDQINKYEMTIDGLIVDNIGANAKNDSKQVKQWALDFINTDDFRAICTVSNTNWANFIAELKEAPNRLRKRKAQEKRDAIARAKAQKAQAKAEAIAKKQAAIEKKKRLKELAPIIGSKKDFDKLINGLTKKVKA